MGVISEQTSRRILGPLEALTVTATDKQPHRNVTSGCYVAMCQQPVRNFTATATAKSLYWLSANRYQRPNIHKRNIIGLLKLYFFYRNAYFREIIVTVMQLNVSDFEIRVVTR